MTGLLTSAHIDGMEESRPPFATRTTHARSTPVVPLWDFISRTRAVNQARSIPTPELSNEEWAALAARLEDEEDSLRLNIRMAETDIAWLPAARRALDDVQYTLGRTDSHPAIHGAPETLAATELCGRHLGMTFRSAVYATPSKNALASVRTYHVDTVHHLKNGTILINGKWPYLHPDTELTVVQAAGSAAA